MYISELAERQIVVVYPGRFQPFHRGHAGVFEKLQSTFGRNNCFIATSPNVKIDDRNPFDAGEKVQLMHAAGITNDRIKLITEPYNITVVTNTMAFNPQNTVLVFAVGAPDRDRLGVDQVYTAQTPKGRKSQIPPGKQVGDAKPMKTFPGIKNIADCVTVGEGHAYVVVVDEIKVPFEFNGEVRDISHGTDCRRTWNEVRNDPKAAAAFLTKLYGRATTELQHIFNQIPAPAQTAQPQPANATLQKVKQTKPVDYTDYELSAESIEESTAKLRAKGLATKKDRFKVLRKEEIEETTAFLTHRPGVAYNYGDQANHNMLGTVQVVKDMHDGSVIVYCEGDRKRYRVAAASLQLSELPVNEMGGVGVVKGGNDPRYMMATAGDQNDVTGDTLGKEMQAYGLVGRKSPGGKTQQRPVKNNIAKG